MLALDRGVAVERDSSLGVTIATDESHPADSNPGSNA